MAAIRIRAARLGFVRLETRAEKIHLIRPSGDRHLIRGRLPRFRSSDPTDRLQELLDLLPSRA